MKRMRTKIKSGNKRRKTPRYALGRFLLEVIGVDVMCDFKISGQLHCHSERSAAESKNLLPERRAWVKDASSAYRLPQHDMV